MKVKKRRLQSLLFLLSIVILWNAGADKKVLAQTRKVKWTVTIAKKNYNYTGKKIKPAVQVKYKGKKLSKKNYTVKYQKNPVKTGTYKVKVTLKGKYKGIKLKGTKTVQYKICSRKTPTKKDDGKKEDQEKDQEQENKNPKDVTVTKTVKGMSIAYNARQFPFTKYTDTDSASGTKREFAQCFFPIFIKKKIKNDFVIHTEYDGKCGFNNFSNAQYIPNRKDPQVVTNMEAYYFYEDDVTVPYEELQKSLYKQGYIGYILVNISCLADKKQSVDIYFGDEKVVTLTSDKFSKLDDFEYWRYNRYDMFLDTAYQYSSEMADKSMLEDVAKCSSDMSDYETYTALNYWITSHTYSEYTCWGAISVAEAMTQLGYPYIQLACSYDDGNGWIYNDYSRYYSLRSKLEDGGYLSMGHRITLIYLDKGKFLYCQVQGGAADGTKFVFNPAGWTRPTNDVSESLSDCKDSFPLNEYSNIEELMKGDYGIDPYQYDAFDWHTWKNFL